MDELNSYVATFVEIVEMVFNDQWVLEEHVLNSESWISSFPAYGGRLVRYCAGTVHRRYQLCAELSSRLNGIMDDWKHSGTVRTERFHRYAEQLHFRFLISAGGWLPCFTNTFEVSFPAFILFQSELRKPQPCLGNFYVTYNGNKVAYLFNKSVTFE